MPRMRSIERDCVMLLIAVVLTCVSGNAYGDCGGVEVPASIHWTDTGFSPSPGDWIWISASGEWSMGQGGWVGPDGEQNIADWRYPLPGAPVGALIGTIGSGTPFLVGSFFSEIRSESGTLFLGPNEYAWGNEHGALCATVAINNWEMPPYEVVSAEFDRSYYQNGVDIAHLTVVTRSNWGDGDNLTLSVEVLPNIGESALLGTDEFTLTLGGNNTSYFDWAVPEFPGLRHCDLYLELSDGRRFLLPVMVYSDIITTNVEEQVIVEAQENMDACDRGAACGGAFVSAVPFLGTATAIQSAEDIHCLGEAFHEQGNDRGASLLRFSEGVHVVMTGVSSFNEVIILTGAGAPLGGALEVAAILVDLANAAAVCGAELAYWDSYGMREEFGTFISELADSALVGFELAGVPYSNHLFVEGLNAVRVVVETDTMAFFSTADSIGVDAAYVYPLPNHNSSWTHIAPAPRPLGSEDENPFDVCGVEVRPEAGVDTLGFVLLHQLGDESVVKLVYPPLLVQEETIARMSLADSVETMPLEVDLDGDGQVDFLWHPGEPSAVEEVTASGTLPAVYSLSVHPNPGMGSATMSFSVSRTLEDVEVVVYDVSGREVKRLPVGDAAPGRQEVIWEASGPSGQLAAGVYHYRVVHSEGQSEARKSILLR